MYPTTTLRPPCGRRAECWRGYCSLVTRLGCERFSLSVSPEQRGRGVALSGIFLMLVFFCIEGTLASDGEGRLHLAVPGRWGACLAVRTPPAALLNRPHV
jgi:hypothetical protein